MNKIADGVVVTGLTGTLYADTTKETAKQFCSIEIIG
jgi:molybdopterin biosynthesis enzyme MoaB